jgi:hypothetical protein
MEPDIWVHPPRIASKLGSYNAILLRLLVFFVPFGKKKTSAPRR